MTKLYWFYTSLTRYRRVGIMLTREGVSLAKSKVSELRLSENILAGRNCPILPYTIVQNSKFIFCDVVISFK